MANGLLGKQAVPAGAYTTVAQVPGGQSGTVNIRLVNRAGTQAIIRLAVCPSSYVDGAVPSDADWIEPPDLPFPPKGILEETAIAVGSGEKVVVLNDTGFVTARVFGYLK